MAVLALLNAGVPVDDAHVKQGLAYLRSSIRAKPMCGPYKRWFSSKRVSRRIASAFTIMSIGSSTPASSATISSCGWTYGKGPSASTDNSNTQYALLGLWAGRQGGVEINRQIWESIRTITWPTKMPTAPGSIRMRAASAEFDRPSLTMTTAGLCGLLIAGMELNVGREVIQPNGVALDCGVYEENKAAAKALGWIGNHFNIENMPGRVFYNLYGLERTGPAHRPALPRRP